MATPPSLAKALRQALDVQVVPALVTLRKAGPVPLLNPRRLEILLTAAAYPGLHLRAAARLVMSSGWTLRHHLKILEARNLVRLRVDRGRVHLFPSRLFPPRFEPFLIAWEGPRERRAIGYLAAHPGATRGEMARSLSLSSSAAARSLDALQAAAVVRTRQTGGRERVWLSGGWHAFARFCARGSSARVGRFLNLLEREGLHPEAERLRDDLFRVTVDGPRSRVRFAFPANPLSRETG